MHLLIVPPLTQASRIPELLDTVRYRVTQIAVAPTTPERAAFIDEFVSGQRQPTPDGDNALTRHYLYIFYEDAVPKTTAQLIADKDREIRRLKPYEQLAGGVTITLPKESPSKPLWERMWSRIQNK